MAALIALLIALEAGVGGLVWLMAHPRSRPSHLASPTRRAVELDGVGLVDPAPAGANQG